jgi:Kef-type K+ transport system membrane component KefB
VNTGVLPTEPSAFIEGFAEVGIVVIMFALGFEENSSDFLHSIKRSWGIAVFGAIAPFLVTYYATLYFWGNHNGSLMCGLAMTATAVSLTLVTLRSEGLQGSRVATGIMTSAVLDDIASLALVAVLVPLASGEAMISSVGIGMILLKTIGFFLLITAMSLWLFPVDSGPLSKIPLLRQFNLQRLITLQGGEHSTLAVLLIALLVALLGHEFGFHPAVGAYMAGLILKEVFFSFFHEKEGVLYTAF